MVLSRQTSAQELFERPSVTVGDLQPIALCDLGRGNGDREVGGCERETRFAPLFPAPALQPLELEASSTGQTQQATDGLFGFASLPQLADLFEWIAVCLAGGEELCWLDQHRLGPREHGDGGELLRHSTRGDRRVEEYQIQGSLSLRDQSLGQLLCSGVAEIFIPMKNVDWPPLSSFDLR